MTHVTSGPAVKTVAATTCRYGKKVYCKLSTGQRLSRFFIMFSIITTIFVILAFLIYLNRKHLSRTLVKYNNVPAATKQNESQQ